jgi:hypothetical protein
MASQVDWNFSPTGATLREGLTYAKWKRALEAAVAVERAGAWCIGDAIIYGEQRYGEKYAQAVGETGLSPERLRVITWVCSRFESDRRRIGLSFESHREVASLDTPDQEKWLDKAERNRWTSKELREQLRTAGKGNRVAGRTTYQLTVTFNRPLDPDTEGELRAELFDAAEEFEPDDSRWARRNG